MSESQQTIMSTVEEMHPDMIGHVLTVSDGDPVRVHLVDTELTIPVTPVKERYGPETTTVPCAYFDAVVDMIEVADGGQTVHGRLHLPEREWRRLGLHKHWEEETAEDWRCERFIQIWLSRFQNASSGDYDDEGYTSPVPNDSPTVTVYDDAETHSESPVAPLDRPEIEIRAAVAESVTDYGNVYERRTVGEVKAIEERDDITEWPEKRDKSRPGGPIELPSRHPDIQFAEIDPLPVTDDVLTAVHAINRHAKRLSDEADAAYHSGAGAEAKVKSTRKKALYDVKTVAVHRLTKSNPSGVDVCVHDLNGDVEMYCFTFPGRFSFHQPKPAVSEGLLDTIDFSADDADVDRIDFTPSACVNELDVSLSEALGVLDGYGIDANSHLDVGVVEDYNYGYQMSTTFTISEGTDE